MEFLKGNLINTTTQITVDSNTILAGNLFDPDPTFQWVSEGNAGNTATSIVFTFSETVTISRIAVQGINLKSFDIFFNGATANAFTITSTGSTVASKFLTNSETAMFMQVAPQAVTSVTFDLKSTTAATGEKAIGFVHLSDVHFVFPRTPASKNFKPKLNRIENIHKLSDGGERIQFVDDKKSADIKYKFIDSSFTSSLRTVYDLKTPFSFCSFPTMTSWDEFFFESVWTGPFGFFELSDNVISAGFSGAIKLREAPR